MLPRTGAGLLFDHRPSILIPSDSPCRPGRHVVGQYSAKFDKYPGSPVRWRAQTPVLDSTPLCDIRDVYVHFEDLPLHRSRTNTAAGDWLTAVQDTAQTQNGHTSFLKLIVGEVVFPSRSHSI